MVRQIAKLFSANAAGQVLAFLLLPVITRLYSEAEMGVMGLFLSITGLLTLAAAGRYEFAILLERGRDKVMFRLTIIISSLFCLLVWVILGVFSTPLFTWLKYGELIPYSQYIAPVVFLGTLGISLSYLNNGRKRFGHTAAYSFLQVMFNNVLKLLPLVSNAGGTVILIASNLVSYLLALPTFVVSRCTCLRKGLYPCLARIHAFLKIDADVLAMARKHRRFPLYALPQSFVSYFAANAVIFLLTAHFGMAEIGLYTVAMMLGYRPLSLLAGAIEQVLAQQLAANVAQPVVMRRIVRRFTFIIIACGIPIFIALYYIIPLFLDLYLPDKWSGVSSQLQVLLPMLFMSLLCSPMSCIPSVVGAQRGALFVEAGMLVGRCAVLIWGAMSGDFILALTYYSIGTSVLMAVQYGWYRLLLRRLDPIR